MMDVCKMAYIRGVEEGPEKETLGVLYDLCLEHVNTNSSGIETKDQETLDELLKACKGWEDDNRSGDAKTIFEHVVLAKATPASQQQTPISAQRQQEEEPATNALLCTSARSLESIFKSQAEDYKARLLAEAEAQVEERRTAMIAAEVEERRAAMIAEVQAQRATMMAEVERNAAKAMSVALKRREVLFTEIEERRVAMMAELEEEKKRKECGITIEEMVNEGPPEKRARKVGLILDMLKNAEPFTADEARPALRARVRWLMRLD